MGSTWPTAPFFFAQTLQRARAKRASPDWPLLRGSLPRLFHPASHDPTEPEGTCFADRIELGLLFLSDAKFARVQTRQEVAQDEVWLREGR